MLCHKLNQAKAEFLGPKGFLLLLGPTFLDSIFEVLDRGLHFFFVFFLGGSRKRVTLFPEQPQIDRC
jgi:hypothetical protein